MKKTNIIAYSVIAAGFVAGVLIFIAGDEPVYGSLDEFAQCISDKGAVMYGADWCPHCQNEKKAFGDSFRLVNYVECPDDPAVCLEKEIKGYPTWILPDSSNNASTANLASNGSEQVSKKLEGEQGLERLSRESGCILPAKYE